MVDFPDPDEPTMATTSPGCAFIETCLSTSISGRDLYLNDTFSSSIEGLNEVDDGWSPSVDDESMAEGFSMISYIFRAAVLATPTA